MKSLEVVVRARDNLKRELQGYIEERYSWIRGRKLSELEDDERGEVGRLTAVIDRMSIQIETLTFVINYDSKLPDATNHFVRRD